MINRILFTCLFCIFVRAAYSLVSLPTVLGDNMVVQRDEPIPVWGWADANESVTVTFNGSVLSTMADANGYWSIDLPASPANARNQRLVVRGSSNEIILEDVLIGDVWLCSGQSNMEYGVSKVMDAKAERAAANHPTIRQIAFNHDTSDKPEDNIRSKGWLVCSDLTAYHFSGVGYFFARRVKNELNIPIGLLRATWAGSRIEGWIPPEGYQSIPALKADYADKLDQFPVVLNGVADHQSPLAIYNGVVHPLTRCKIKGVIWYQGESNVGDGLIYYDKLNALIAGYRSVFQKPDLPFYFVQLAPYQYRTDSQELPKIWQSQLNTFLEVPNTGMVVTTDIGTPTNVHPPNKQEVGKRLANWALRDTYGIQGLISSGPIFDSISTTGNQVAVHFQAGTADGLFTPAKCEKVSHFEICGADGVWSPAQANIVGNTVILTSFLVPEPTSVRFGWHHTAVPNLFNGALLPASPFNSTF